MPPAPSDPPVRSSEEIRTSIQAARTELTASVNDLQGKVREISDWRGHLRRNPTVALAAAAGAGFVLGGGIAGVLGLFTRR